VPAALHCFPLRSLVECLPDELAAAVEVGKLGEDGRFELVAVEPFAVAAFAAELLAALGGR
jgi:hypothetical protein